MDGIKVKSLQTKDGLNTVDISLYGEIGDGYEESDLQSVSQKISGADKVTVRINSFGGSSADGIGIYNLLKGSKAEVEIVIMGVAMSAADCSFANFFFVDAATADVEIVSSASDANVLLSSLQVSLLMILLLLILLLLLLLLL